MSWAVTPFAAKEPLAVDSLMLALGKSLYLACEFEQKCQYVLRVFNLSAKFEATGDLKATFKAAKAAKDRLLAQTIEGMAKISVVAPEEIDDLTKARAARNYIAHEAGKVGSLHELRAEDITEDLAALRRAVIDLAKGDNVISIWHLAITEKLDAPEWMTQTYEARVLSWVFGEPFRGVLDGDAWTRMQLAERSR